MIKSRRTGGASRLGSSLAEIAQELRPGVLAGPQEDGVGVPGRLFRHGRHMQAAHRHEDAFGPVFVRDPVSAIGGGDVDLEDDQVGAVAQVELLDVLVAQGDLVVGVQIRSQSGQSEYLIGRKNGLVASVSAGRMSRTFIAAAYRPNLLESRSGGRVGACIHSPWATSPPR